ncbi:zinc finger BED domain-containing protein RICESLEEPER 1-like [Prunus persica]|uniref:zinc finger BED domain-containing protein RICESLEEPER 1-like n=1 Tax=Prunus persica TaxID=3760 RepID=UPI0009AB6964|nr:zinc finger BED domain-containing protein RICESLEEPER 1-like [Prunus persica]
MGDLDIPTILASLSGILLPTIARNCVTEDQLRIRVFPYTLKDKAKYWLNSLKPGSLTTWAAIQKKFLEIYFSSQKINILRDNILLFAQQDDESFCEAWERFNGLLNQYPHHGIPLKLQMRGMDTFDGISESAKGGVGVGEVRNNVVDSDPSNNNNAVVTQIGKRRRKLTSAVWTQFEILPIDENNEQRAKCMKCGQKYLCDSRYGTGNLKRHIESCVKTDTRDLGQLLLSKYDGAILTRSSKFDPMKFRELLLMAIIMHDLPFQFVEYAGIRQLFNYVCADIKLVSRNIAKADVLSLYNREKAKLKEILGSVPGRVCLTFDLWTSITTDGYLCLTVHFIDVNWKWEKIILNFSFMPPPHTGVALCEKIYRLLTDWGVKKKLFSMTLDNASSNDTFVELLKGQLNLKDALLMNGKFFHIRCCAHILNLIVQDGLKHIDDSVGKIRESIKYARGSQGRKQKFLNCAAQVSLECKKGDCVKMYPLDGTRRFL